MAQDFAAGGQGEARAEARRSTSGASPAVAQARGATDGRPEDDEQRHQEEEEARVMPADTATAASEPRVKTFMSDRSDKS